jgi:uncharacterized membrane protein
MITLVTSKVEYVLRKIFQVGIFTKALNGLWETTVGVLIIYLHPSRIQGVFNFLGERELFQHPRDGLIRYGMHALQTHGTREFVAFYFLIHGIINLFLAIQLYRNRLWAYIATISISSIFIIYQFHRIDLYHSRLLMLVTIYDILFTLLTWHEYKHQKSIRALV